MQLSKIVYLSAKLDKTDPAGGLENNQPVTHGQEVREGPGSVLKRRSVLATVTKMIYKGGYSQKTRHSHILSYSALLSPKAANLFIHYRESRPSPLLAESLTLQDINCCGKQVDMMPLKNYET